MTDILTAAARFYCPHGYPILVTVPTDRGLWSAVHPVVCESDLVVGTVMCTAGSAKCNKVVGVVAGQSLVLGAGPGLVPLTTDLKSWTDRGLVRFEFTSSVLVEGGRQPCGDTTDEPACLTVRYHFANGRPVTDLPVRVRFPNGEVRHARLGPAGECRIDSPWDCEVEVDLGDPVREEAIARVRDELRKTLDAVVAEARLEARDIDRALRQRNVVRQELDYVFAFAEGLYESGEAMVGLALWAWKALTAAAVDLKARTARAFHERSLDDFRKGLDELGRRGLVAADTLKRMYATASDVLTDGPSVELLWAFASDYVAALHPREAPRLVGALMFDVVLALCTEGVGLAASALARCRYATPARRLLARLGKLLGEARLSRRVRTTSRAEVAVTAEVVPPLAVAPARRAAPHPPRPRFTRTGGVILFEETAGTGGIRLVHADRLPDGAIRYVIEGELRAPIPDGLAPRYNQGGKGKSRFFSAEEAGLPRDYERSHLYGPGLGDEAADGIMYAPQEFNRVYQGRIEAQLRAAHKAAEAEGGGIALRVTGTSHPPAPGPRGRAEILKSVNYEVYRKLPSGEEKFWYGVTLELDTYPSRRVRIHGRLSPDFTPPGGQP